ncbi:unnamed protein product [Caenorhabditis brenneri]
MSGIFDKNLINRNPRKFVLKHVFKNVSTMNDSENLISPTEDHFGLPWYVDIRHDKEHLGVYLYCRRTENRKEWSIDTEFEIRVLHPNGNPAHKTSVFSDCFTEAIGRGKEKLMTWKRMKKEFLLNGELIVEIRVKIIKITGIENFHLNMSGTDDKLSPVEKQMNQEPRSFVLKHVFKNVSNMKNTEQCYGSTEDHFGVPWCLGIKHKENHLGVYLYCNRSEKEEEWSIDTEYETHILYPNGNAAHKNRFSYCFTEAVGNGSRQLITWERMKEKFLLNDELVVEIHVKITKVTGIEDFHSNMPGTVDKLSTFKNKLNQKSRSFQLKHKFKNVSKMEDTEFCYSSPEDHYGIQWFIAIGHKKAHLGVYLHCYKHENNNNWSIDTNFEIHILHPNGNLAHKVIYIPYCFKNIIGYGQNDLMTWERIKEECTVKDELIVEVRVKITKITGIELYLRRFDDEDRSDVALVANEKKFHVSKLLLASESSYFKSMFLGKFSESGKTEIELSGIDAFDLQKYLEMLYGEDALDDETVEGILHLADMYDTKTLVRRCEEYLSEVSRKTLKEKLELSVKYKLVELKKKCMSEIETGDDLRSVIIERIRDMDHNTLADLLEKTLDLK